MAYRITYKDGFLQRVMPTIPLANRVQISKAIDERLTADPVGIGKPLRYNLKGYRRLRVGDWRVIYRIEGDNVIICDIGDRKDVYEP